MTGEYRRALDAPSQQPLTEIVFKTPHPIEVDRVLINPHDLDDYAPADGAMLREQGVIHDRKPIVLPPTTFGCAGLKGCSCRAYPECHRSAPTDAAPHGMGLGGSHQIHHMRVADLLLIAWANATVDVLSTSTIW
jgi:hypothetical protein